MADNVVHMLSNGDKSTFKDCRVAETATPVDRTLEVAKKANLASVIVMGWDAQGNEYFASSDGMDGADALWLLERMKLQLLT